MEDPVEKLSHHHRAIEHQNREERTRRREKSLVFTSVEEAGPLETRSTSEPDPIITRMTPNDSQLILVSPVANECPRCQARFVCEIALGRDHCWCMALPAVVPVGTAARCLCCECLAQLIGESRTSVDEVEP